MIFPRVTSHVLGKDRATLKTQDDSTICHSTLVLPKIDGYPDRGIQT